MTTKRTQEIRPSSIPSEESFGSPTVWSTYRFAPEWFEDALNEAKTGVDHYARRREIVFAVCCAESYIVEWVRDEVLRTDLGKVSDYFPPGEGISVTKKWKEVPKRLFQKGLIPAAPNWGWS